MVGNCQPTTAATISRVNNNKVSQSVSKFVGCQSAAAADRSAGPPIHHLETGRWGLVMLKIEEYENARLIGDAKCNVSCCWLWPGLCCCPFLESDLMLLLGYCPWGIHYVNGSPFFSKWGMFTGINLESVISDQIWACSYTFHTLPRMLSKNLSKCCL